jgi:uncharacterized membrane protein
VKVKLTVFALDNIGGIPAHPLMVHIPVVLVPLAFILTIASLWKRFRTPILIAAAITAGLGGIGALLAGGSGESLVGAVRGKADRQLLHEHTESGGQAQGAAGALAGVAIVTAAEEVLRRKGKLPKALNFPKWVPAGLLAASIATGAVATYMVYDAGHTGAKSVWNGVKAVGEGGERGGDDD